MYLPISVLFPLIIFAYGIYYKNMSLRIAGIWLGVFVVSFIFLMLSLSSWLAGNSLYVIDTGRGIFIDQLIHWYPYLPASFINLDFIAQLIAKVTGITYTNAFKLFEIINTVILSFLLFLLLRYLFSLKKINPNKSSVFILSGAAISLCILFLITYFSLTYKPQLYGIYLWNYNYESRYFAFIYVFLPMLLLLFIHLYPSLLKRLFSRILIVAGLFILLAEVAHGVYYNVKILTRNKDVELIRNRVADFEQFPSMIKELKAKYPDHDLLVSASDQSFLHNASEMGYKAIFNYTSLNQIDLRVAKKSILLFPIHETDVWVMKDYLERRKPDIMTKIAGTVFFIEEINP
jgi:hypothetical protein